MAHWKAREPKYDWRAFLTPEEAKAVAAWDKELSVFRSKASKISQQRNPIVNRAIHRAKYAAQRNRT